MAGCSRAPIWLTVEVVLWATLLQLTLGIALGWLLARKQFVGKGLLDVAVMLPLVFPPIVLGYALLVALGRHGQARANRLHGYLAAYA
jgi:molybdate transport system permease protein